MVNIPSPVAGRNHSLGIEDRGNAFEAYYNFRHPPHPLEALFTFGPGEEREAAAEAVQWMADIAEERAVLVEERAGFTPWSRATWLTLIPRDELTEQRTRRVVSVSSWCETFDETGLTGNEHG